MYQEALEAIINRLAEVKKLDPETLNENTHFYEDLSGTSLELAHLGTFLESEFDVDLPYMKFSKQKTLGEMAKFIEKAM